MAEYMVKAGARSGAVNFTGFNAPVGGGLSTKTVDRNSPVDINPRVVIYPDSSGSGVELDPGAMDSSGMTAAINSIKFGRPVSNNEFTKRASPPPEPIPEPISEPIPEPKATAQPVRPYVPAQAPPAIKQESIVVSFERENGDSFVAHYSEVIEEKGFLTLVYDHSNKPGVLYRPGTSEEVIYIGVEAHEGKPEKVYSCYPTGYRVRFKTFELIAFVIEEVRDL